MRVPPMRFFMGVITDDGKEARVGIPDYPQPIGDFGPPAFLDDVHARRLLECYQALEHHVAPNGPELPQQILAAL